MFGNVVIQIYQVFKVSWLLTFPKSFLCADELFTLNTLIYMQPKVVNSITGGFDPIDKAGYWIVQATLDVVNVAEGMSTAQGLEELKKFKDDIAPNVGLTLEVVDRAVLETKIRGV